MPTGSPRWPASSWQQLLTDAIGLIDTLAERPPWVFGGGTALAIFLQHRISYDIDIFFRSTDPIAALAPNRNPATKALLNSRAYQYPGHYLKLNLPAGEIDFIAASPRTRDPCRSWSFAGTAIQIDNPWETICKKVFYRPSTFKVRDIFDVAAAADGYGDAIVANLGEVEDRIPQVCARIRLLLPEYERRCLDEVNMTDTGRTYATAQAAGRALDLLESYRPRSP